MSFHETCAIPHEGQLLPAFPILMPASWERASTQVCGPIIKGLDLREVPLLAPVHFIGDPNTGEFRRIYIRTERLAAIGKTEREYLIEALHNLQQRRATWIGPTRDVLMAEDDFLAAERILDGDFMLDASRRLGDESLLVGIPQRATLFATSYTRVCADPMHARTFAGIVANMFAQAGERRITPWPFLVSNGRIVSILEIE